MLAGRIRSFVAGAGGQYGTTSFAVALRRLTRRYQPCSCRRCVRTFDTASKYLDLTVTSGIPQQVYEQKQWQGTELFRQPLVSFIYERGWRQNFAGAGFPGPEKEFDQAMQYLAPAEGGILVDASCGTGLFTRLFARSQRFKGVVALDFRWGRQQAMCCCVAGHSHEHAYGVHTCLCS